MISAIKTLENHLHGLKIELVTWSNPKNFSQEILDKVNIEIEEHEQALQILKTVLKQNETSKNN